MVFFFFFPGCRWLEDGFGDYLPSLRPKEKGGKDSGQAGGRKEIGFYLDELDFTFTANFSCQYLAC